MAATVSADRDDQEVVGPTAPAAARLQRSVADRWTPALSRAGHVPIVRTFLRSYSSLTPPLTVGEAMFVIHLMDYKWDAGKPFPGYGTIARYMGISAKMARRHAQNLEKKKYLVRELRVAQTNKFDLTPLFLALENELTRK